MKIKLSWLNKDVDGAKDHQSCLIYSKGLNEVNVHIKKDQIRMINDRKIMMDDR